MLFSMFILAGEGAEQSPQFVQFPENCNKIALIFESSDKQREILFGE